jgi:hypothetical protein
MVLGKTACLVKGYRNHSHLQANRQADKILTGFGFTTSSFRFNGP